MKRRTFIGMAALAAVSWMPSITKTRPATGVADTSYPIHLEGQLEERDSPPEGRSGTFIKVIGVGGAGAKAIEHMIGNSSVRLKRNP